MALDPWSYAEKTRKEHAEQVALFMWANMARLFGYKAAGDKFCYSEAGYGMRHYGPNSAYPDKPITQLKWLHAVHNQGHGDKVRGAQAKAEGVKAGVADVFLPVPKYPGLIASKLLSLPPHPVPETELASLGLYIELKKKDGGTPSDIQLEFQADMRAAGYRCEIIHGWELARDEILAYLGVS